MFLDSGEGDPGHRRNIREAMYISVNDPSSNNKSGKVPATPCMGPSTQGHTYTAPQVAHQPSPPLQQSLSPL